MSSRTKGLIQLIASLFFIFLAFIKVTGQPLSGLLYTSRVTIALYLLISLLLAISALFLLSKTPESHNNEDFNK